MDPYAAPLLGYFFSLLLMMHSGDLDVPILAGPYDDWSQCASVREYLDRRGYETSDCELMSIPQQSFMLHVGDVP
jgi:hypothetical protein